MSVEENTIYVVVPVKVPEGFALTDELAKYLNKFIEIGLTDLQETVEDEEIATDEEDELVATQTEWGHPFIEQKF